MNSEVLFMRSAINQLSHKSGALTITVAGAHRSRPMKNLRTR